MTIDLQEDCTREGTGLRVHHIVFIFDSNGVDLPYFQCQKCQAKIYRNTPPGHEQEWDKWWLAWFKQRCNVPWTDRAIREEAIQNAATSIRTSLDRLLTLLREKE